MKARKVWIVSAVIACSTLASCSALSDMFSAGREAPVDEDQSYLTSGGGPTTDVDLGAGEEQLLTRFQTVLEQKLALEKRESDLLVEIEALRSSLQHEQETKESEQRLRVGAEAEADRLRALKTDRELKILHLQMRIADLQQSKLQLEIAGIERQIEIMDAKAGTPAQPPGGGR